MKKAFDIQVPVVNEDLYLLITAAGCWLALLILGVTSTGEAPVT